MNNPEKLATQGTQCEEKHNTVWVGHHYAHTNTKNVNKTCGLLQTTGGKVEPNIILLRKSWRTSKHVKTQNRTTQKKTKKISNTDSTKKPGVNTGAREE